MKKQKAKSKKKIIIIRVDEDFKRRLDDVVEREYVNLSALVRNFLENWLKEKEERSNGLEQKRKLDN